ncbi:hypothetical protein VTK73DRAFT_6240 [Phialemonium thermophilum]|uniref:Uncharacterized protein n=1 Tax=Phialemonium thermophilum TaxID=223376 RepID=A0ABR3V0G8_9PEZI
MPQAPSGLQVATIREGATVQLTFDADPNAFAYGFFTRSLLEGDDALYVPGGYTSDVPCIGVTFLVPGAWNYEFCVVAYNGNYTSPMSECVRGPKEITSVPDCPAAVGPVGGPDPNPTVTWTQPSPTPIGGGGDGNGDGGGDIVYIDPLIWGQPDPTVFCQPPCTLVLPPWPVDGGLTTISFPPATETIEETWPETSDGLLVYASSTTTVTITLEAVTASVVNVSNIVIPTTATTTTGGVVVLLTVTSSVDPPPTTITESSHHVTWTYSAGPYPTGTAAVGPPPGRNPGTIHFSATITRAAGEAAAADSPASVPAAVRGGVAASASDA